MLIQFRTAIFAFIIIFLVSCKSEKERESQKLQSDLNTYFQANLMDSTSALDSFRVIKIDTITQRMLLSEQSSVLNGQIDNLLELYELSNKGISNSLDKMKIYSMLESQDLVDIERKDIDKEKAKRELVKAELDTVMAIVKTIDDKALSADTTKPIGYQAKCFYQVRLKDKSVKQDSTFIILNVNKDIVKRTDFLKLPYNVDFEKLY